MYKLNTSVFKNNESVFIGENDESKRSKPLNGLLLFVLLSYPFTQVEAPVNAIREP